MPLGVGGGPPHAGAVGSQPRSAPEDYMPGDERPGQRDVGAAFSQLAKLQNKQALFRFLNALGERQDSTIAAQNTLDAGGSPGSASTFFGH